MYLPLSGPILIKGIAHSRRVQGPTKIQIRQSSSQRFADNSQS